MIEIRPIRRDEADEFLELMCSVFELDLVRAHSVFYTEPMFDLGRKWALFEDGQMVSILTTTPLIFGWGRASGIAGVATRRELQGRGYGSRLLKQVLAEFPEEGALLFAKDCALYEKAGFEAMDVVIRASVSGGDYEPDEPLEDEEVRQLYNQWAALHPARLRRDALRWSYWKWHFRICSPLADGYLCYEPGLLREVVSPGPVRTLPVTPDCEWFGLMSMARELRLKLTNVRAELHLMGRNVPILPQMFMTDQF